MKEVQTLNGSLAALDRFTSWSMDKCRLFFQVLRKNGDNFFGNKECETSFQELKKYLASPPLLSKPSLRDAISLFHDLGVSSEQIPNIRR